MGVGGGAIGYVSTWSVSEYHLPYNELSHTTKVNPQRRLYCPTCLSGSATVVSLDICFGRKQSSATSFMSLIIIVWWTGIPGPA